MVPIPFKKGSRIIINDGYSHLYSRSTYEPPSIKRALEEASVREGEEYGNSRVKNTHSIESITGQTGIDYLIEKKLRNKDLYREIKNKAVYSLDSNIASHSALNKL